MSGPFYLEVGDTLQVTVEAANGYGFGDLSDVAQFIIPQ
jgi:hypothetical protein